ncbi:hypothetical protein HMPREF9449_00946 [Odoribacter laneus YIT 12061]|uniref:Polysaccharide biosynthesis protein C-terminal domain-containing protein n=1 Tax=Odoribacter laneus YIT 12061 TaxID=742817 RepID=H1DFB0_9BACT|nr:hypothetical protein HMPREF9449_00946 [Odoribacter laneus YIT 12061]
MSSEIRSNNKRILKNTGYLYVQQILVLFVSLYTVRVVLNTLGVEDYGIFNVVGGVVSMFGFLQGMLVSAVQRFFAYELGRNNYDRLNQYFNTSLWCFGIIALIVVTLAETIGLWFINTQLIIPQDRIGAAQWVFHLSVLSFVFNLLMTPFNSIIIARERMKVYAFVGMADVVLKLLIVFALTLFSFDKLQLYAILLCLLSFIHALFYIIYSHAKFQETRITGYCNRGMMKEVMSYCGWSLFGSLSSVIRSQGLNMLINMFFNPAVNAARGIAYQVNSVVNMFVTNFSTAFRPQITKQYAAGERDSMMHLVFRSTRMCYYLVLFFFVPITLETHYILQLWLGEIPEYTVVFVRLVLLIALVESIGNPIMATIQATGNIKWYQTIVGGLLLLNLPISYVLLRSGYPPQSTMAAGVVIAFASHIARIFFMHKQVNMSIRAYVKGPMLTIFFVTLCVIVVPYLLHTILEEGLLRFLLVGVTSVSFSALSIYYIGLTNSERLFFREMILSKLSKDKQ